VSGTPEDEFKDLTLDNPFWRLDRLYRLGGK